MKKNILRQIVMLSRLTFYGLITQLVFTGILIAAEGQAQSVKSVRENFIRIEFKNSSIIDAFNKIEQKTGYHFAYEKGEISNKIRLDKKYNGKIAVSEVLLDISEEADLKFRQVNKSIIVSEKRANSSNENNLEIIIQGLTITGKITSDEDSDGLPGVNVVVKGTSIGTVTDIEGNYKLDVTDENSILVFSSVGFTTEEIVVGNQSVIDLAMVADLTSLEEIVVIGYGTAKKSDLTGSVSNVSSEKLVDRPAVNIGEALQNKVAGVQVIRSGGGVPGSRPVIRIRGTNSINTNSDPLFVVDGIIGVSNALENINPNDILSMDILKDASATAIYGTRGANGVVIITTKRGEAGETKVNYSGSMTLGTMQRRNYTVNTDQFFYLYEQAFNNTPKYGTLKTEKDYRGGKGTGASWSEMPHLFEQVSQGDYFMDLIGNDGNYYKPRFYSDWEDLAFNNSFSYDQHIDVSGGSENAKFSLSIGNTNQQGLMLQSYYKRTNAKVNK